MVWFFDATGWLHKGLTDEQLDVGTQQWFDNFQNLVVTCMPRKNRIILCAPINFSHRMEAADVGIGFQFDIVLRKPGYQAIRDVSGSLAEF